MRIFQTLLTWLKTFIHIAKINFDGDDHQLDQRTAMQNNTETVPESNPKPQPKSTHPKPKVTSTPTTIKLTSKQPQPHRTHLSFTESLQKELDHKQVHNLSITTIPSPGSIIHTSIYNQNQVNILVYALNLSNYRIRLTEKGQVLADTQQNHPDYDLDLSLLKVYGIDILTTNDSEQLIIDTDLNHFARDLSQFIKILDTLEK